MRPAGTPGERRSATRRHMRRRAAWPTSARAYCLVKIQLAMDQPVVETSSEQDLYSAPARGSNDCTSAVVRAASSQSQAVARVGCLADPVTATSYSRAVDHLITARASDPQLEDRIARRPHPASGRRRSSPCTWSGSTSPRRLEQTRRRARTSKCPPGSRKPPTRPSPARSTTLRQEAPSRVKASWAFRRTTQIHTRRADCSFTGRRCGVHRHEQAAEFPAPPTTTEA